MRLELRTKGPRLDPAEVQDRTDQVVQPGRLRVDDHPRGARVLGGPGHRRVDKAAGRGPDARERGPQVVRDRVDERGLEGVALPSDLRLRRVLPELIPSQREPDLVGGQREDPRLGAVRQPARSVARRPDLSEELGRSCRSIAGRRLDPHPEDLASPAERLAAATGLVRPNPSRGLIAGRANEGREDGARRDLGAGRRVGDDALPSRLAYGDPDTAKACIGRQPPGKVGGGLIRRVGGGEEPAHREEARRLARTGVSLLGPMVLEGDQAADGDGDEEEQQQVEPLARVADDE